MEKLLRVDVLCLDSNAIAHYEQYILCVCILVCVIGKILGSLVRGLVEDGSGKKKASLS